MAFETALASIKKQKWKEKNVEVNKEESLVIHCIAPELKDPTRLEMPGGIKESTKGADILQTYDMIKVATLVQ